MGAGPIAQGWEPGRVVGGGPCQGAVGEPGGAGVLGGRHPQRDFRDRSPARAGQPETPAFLRCPLDRLGRGLCRRLARDVDPTRGGPAQRRAQLDFSRIRQGKAVRFSGNRIGIQVAGIVDEELRPLFDQLAHDFAGAAAPGRDLRESLRKIREGIGAEVLRLDGLTAPSHNHIIKLVHEQIDSAQKLISAQISERQPRSTARRRARSALGSRIS